MKTALLLFLTLVSLLTPGKLTEGMIDMRNIGRVNSLFLLTATVAMEAEGESYKGKLAVAYVIINRAKQRNKFVSEVVLDPYDFSAWNTKGGRQLDLEKINEFSWWDSEKAAHSAYYGIEKDPTQGADHYLNVELTRKLRGGTLPAWLLVMKRTAKIGLHTFYKEVK